jgi:hypothetical protein
VGKAQYERFSFRDPLNVGPAGLGAARGAKLWWSFIAKLTDSE